MQKILYGKPVAENLEKEINQILALLREKNKIPKIALIRIGDNKDDITYEKSLIKKLEYFGIDYDVHLYSQNISENMEKLKTDIKCLNEDVHTDAIMIFRPLPHPEIERHEINEMIDWKKDIDCATSYNQGKLFEKTSNIFYPCTPRAVLELLRYYKVELESKKCTIIGASQVVGKTLAIMLIKEKATVTVCHSKTLNLKEEVQRADIVISAIGIPKFIKRDFLREGQVVIDVGVNFDENNKMCGDVDFENIQYEDIKITPVPKGIGVITTLTLVKQLVEKTLKLG